MVSIASLLRRAWIGLALFSLCPYWAQADQVAGDARPPAAAAADQTWARDVALDLFSDDRYESEIDFLDVYLAQEPGDGYGFFLRGLAYFDLDAYGPAEVDLSRTIGLMHRFGPAYRLRCKARYEQGHAAEAKDDCDTALRINPSDGRAETYRGDVFMDLRRAEQALGDYDAAIRIGVHPGFMYSRADATPRRISVALTPRGAIATVA